MSNCNFTFLLSWNHGNIVRGFRNIQGYRDRIILSRGFGNIQGNRDRIILSGDSGISRETGIG